jgi:AcrR family transcriptional regulator
MGHVAAAARVGKGTIYQYFHSKDDLFFQTITWGLDELCAILHEKVPADLPFAKRLTCACEEITAFFERRQPLFRVLQTEDARMAPCRAKMREHWLANRHKLPGALAVIIAKGVAEGEIRSDYPAEVLATVLLGLLGLMSNRDLSEGPEEFRSCQALIELFLHGAGAARRDRPRGPGSPLAAGPALPDKEPGMKQGKPT